MKKSSSRFALRDICVGFLELVKIKYIRKSINDFSILLPVKGHPLNKLFLKKDYWRDHEESPYSKKILECLEPGDCVFDIGGFLGYYTILMSNAVGSKGQVVTFEPNFQSFDTLRRTIHANSFLNNVRLVQTAITDTEGYVEFDLSEDESSIQMNKDIRGAVEIAATTLDAFAKKEKMNPRLIKIDVEGFEMKVLQGGKSILSTCQYVCCEVHPKKMQRATGHTEKELEDFLGSLGFKSFFKFRSKKSAVDSTSPYNVIYKNEK
ncbi:MAG: FkbM family methyltransferase [Balneolaceae bacterium]